MVGAAHPTKALLVLQDVAHASYGMDELLFEVLVYLGTEVVYVDIDDIRLAVKGLVPDMLGDERPREHAVGVA